MSESQSHLVKLRLDQIRTDGGTQARVAVNRTTVREYAEAMRDGQEFPPVEVMFDGQDFWLWDGFQRRDARQLLADEMLTPVEGKTKHYDPELLTILANVTEGTRRDAFLACLGANATHGLPRSNGDKRNAVLRALEDAEIATWSDREIARLCRVSPTFVGSVRRELSVHDGQIDEQSEPAPAERKVKRGRTSYTMRTDTINVRPDSIEVATEKIIDALRAIKRWAYFAEVERKADVNGKGVCERALRAMLERGTVITARFQGRVVYQFDGTPPPEADSLRPNYDQPQERPTSEASEGPDPYTLIAIGDNGDLVEPGLPIPPRDGDQPAQDSTEASAGEPPAVTLPPRQVEFLQDLAAGRPVVKNPATRYALIRLGCIEPTQEWDNIVMTDRGRAALLAHQQPAPEAAQEPAVATPPRAEFHQRLQTIQVEASLLMAVNPSHWGLLPPAQAETTRVQLASTRRALERLLARINEFDQVLADVSAVREPAEVTG